MKKYERHETSLERVLWYPRVQLQIEEDPIPLDGRRAADVNKLAETLDGGGLFAGPGDRGQTAVAVVKCRDRPPQTGRPLLMQCQDHHEHCRLVFLDHFHHLGRRSRRDPTHRIEEVDHSHSYCECPVQLLLAFSGSSRKNWDRLVCANLKICWGRAEGDSHVVAVHLLLLV